MSMRVLAFVTIVLGAIAAASHINAAAAQATVVALPYFAGAHAIWGATGQDTHGHVWFGVTSEGLAPESAHLFEYMPQSASAVDRGDVVTELKRAGVWRQGEQQAKIHSKIVQGPANYLYFASMDEAGEHEDGSKLPIWGGHLWRISLATYRWEHLTRTPEALIAVGSGGRYVYALGYFGHVLYQYDTETGRTARVEVGSVDGHISRNVLVDDRGHAFVPRLSIDASTQSAARRVRVALVELGTDLKQIGETALEPAQYLGRDRPADPHGIGGLQVMNDRSIHFPAHAGLLGHIVPPPPRPGGAIDHRQATVVAVRWLHPEGPSYAASLFVSADGQTLASL